MKRKLNFFSLALMLAMFCCNVSIAQMKTNGRFVYTKCGEKVIFRGAEHMLDPHDPDGNNIAEVAKSGANCIRLLLFANETPGARLEALIKKCVDAKMFCSIGVWNPELNMAWWQRADIKAAFAKYKDYVIIHAYGEAIWDNQTQWRADVKARILAIRAEGYEQPLDVLSNMYGRDPFAVINYPNLPLILYTT